MNVEASTGEPLAIDADTIAMGVFEGEEPAHELPGVADLLASGEARRTFKRLAHTHADGRRVVLVGLGDRARFDAERARAAAAVAHRRARELSAQSLCWALPAPGVAGALVEGTLLHAYRFDRYAAPREDKRELGRLILSAPEDIADEVREAAILATAQNRARDLGNTPANDLNPSAFADYAAAVAARHALRAEILDGEAIREHGMGAFAAVAQGSRQDPRLIRLDYDGAPDAPRLALVGKAVTFDSGGLSLKPARSMHEMKFDMCGGAAVIEAIAALAELRVPVRVTAVVGATENLPGGTAVKPGDIVRALDGTTIEINNTDAEGRLVLADCLTYAVREGVERIVDVATLTGGVVTALGHTYAGLMSNDDGWAHAVEGAGRRTGELVWRLPLHEEYADMVKGRVAQLTNLTARTGASSITGAEFLHHFVGEVPWAHLDIVGMAWDVRRPYLDRAATGYGVRLLVELARSLARSS